MKKRGWDDLGEWHWNMYNIIYEPNRQSRFDTWYWMLGAGALRWPRGMVRGGRWEMVKDGEALCDAVHGVPLLPAFQESHKFFHQQTHGISASLCASADATTQRLASSLHMAYSGHVMTFQSSSYGYLPSFQLFNSKFLKQNIIDPAHLLNQ